MHGRVKVRTTAEQEEIKKKEREKKLQLYNAATEKIFDKRNKSVMDDEGLKLCSDVLLINPNYYTLWNFKKEIFLAFKETRSPENLQTVFENELYFIESCLKISPKSYGCWDQRIFVMNNIQQPNWKRELSLCNKFLEYDERNFHCWDYRRFIVKNSASITNQNEFDFTTDKISSNFSNFSSWHYRSKLLPLIEPEPNQAAGVKEEALLKEFEIVQNAIFTDPDDQSAWFYHKWLLGREKIKPELVQAVLSRKTETVVVSITKPIHPLESGSKLTVKVNDYTITSGWYNPFHNEYHCPVWILKLPDEILTADNVAITVELLEQSTAISTCNLTWKNSMKNPSHHSNTIKPAAIFNSELSAAKCAILETELQSIQELLQLETENKWATLTVVQLMKAIDSLHYGSDIKNYLDKLQTIDPKRDNYYKDFKSKVIIENTIKLMDSSEVKLQLSSIGLSVMYHLEYLITLQELDLSNNHISNPHNFAYLQCAEFLNLDNNQLDNVDGLELLPNLTSLSLRTNSLSSIEVLRPLQCCATLTTVYLAGNPLADDGDYRTDVKQLLPHLKQIDDIAMN